MVCCSAAIIINHRNTPGTIASIGVRHTGHFPEVRSTMSPQSSHTHRWRHGSSSVRALLCAARRGRQQRTTRPPPPSVTTNVMPDPPQATAAGSCERMTIAIRACGDAHAAERAAPVRALRALAVGRSPGPGAERAVVHPPGRPQHMAQRRDFTGCRCHWQRSRVRSWESREDKQTKRTRLSVPILALPDHRAARAVRPALQHAHEPLRLLRPCKTQQESITEWSQGLFCMASRPERSTLCFSVCPPLTVCAPVDVRRVLPVEAQRRVPHPRLEHLV